MSSEYIYDREAINLRGAKSTYTALFTKSHSSNDGDHTPRWKLYYFSKQEDAMPYVAQCAHYCDSGLTRGPGGRPLSGEREISLWREAVNAARLLNDNGSSRVDLIFSSKPSMDADGIPTMMAILKIAETMGVSCEHHIADASTLPPARSFMTLNLSDPAHVDLVWTAVNTIKVPSLYTSGSMVGLGPYRFFSGVKAALQLSLALPADPQPLVTQPVKVRTGLLEKYLSNSFYKFEFPVRGQAHFKDSRAVVVNWACRLLSSDPEGWFAKKLATLEKVQPGCAESAYRAWKRHLKALPITPVEKIGTIEVCPLNGQFAAAESETRATMQSLEGWQQDTVKAFFAARGKNPEAEAVYTTTPEEHLEALCMSAFVPCCMAVDAMAQA